MARSTFSGPMAKFFIFDGKKVVLLEFFIGFSFLLTLFLVFNIFLSISLLPKASLGLGSVNLVNPLCHGTAENE